MSDETKPLLSPAGHDGEDTEEGEELTGCGATVACNPHRSVHRFLVLIIMCFLSFGKTNI
jgi:hypothetical protein